jgi:mRNA interferase HigB
VKRLREFIDAYPDSEAPLATWHRLVKTAKWKHLSDLKLVFPSADLVERRTVFNIGQRYRLIARINYESKKAFVLYVLTHSEYDAGKWKQ